MAIKSVYKSPLQEAYWLKDSYSWGRFTIYSEYGEDGFATRSVREYENRYLTRYDRVHWEDQFGMLPDFRFGKAYIKNWGEPDYITSEEFEKIWKQAETSPPFLLRNPSPKEPCLWIELFESGKWKGQL